MSKPVGSQGELSFLLSKALCVILPLPLPFNAKVPSSSDEDAAAACPCQFLQQEQSLQLPPHICFLLEFVQGQHSSSGSKEADWLCNTETD